MKKLTNQEVVQIANGVNDLMAYNLELPAKVGYALLKNGREIETVIVPYEEQRKKSWGKN